MSIMNQSVVALVRSIYDSGDLDFDTAVQLAYFGNSVISDRQDALNDAFERIQAPFTDEERARYDAQIRAIVGGVPAPNGPTPPMKAVTLYTDTEIIDAIHKTLYPPHDPFVEWSSDEIEIIANLIAQVRKTPSLDDIPFNSYKVEWEYQGAMLSTVVIATSEESAAAAGWDHVSEMLGIRKTLLAENPEVTLIDSHVNG